MCISTFKLSGQTPVRRANLVVPSGGGRLPAGRIIFVTAFKQVLYCNSPAVFSATYLYLQS